MRNHGKSFQNINIKILYKCLLIKIQKLLSSTGMCKKNVVFGDKNLLSYTSGKKYSVTQLCDIKDQSMNLRRHS